MTVLKRKTASGIETVGTVAAPIDGGDITTGTINQDRLPARQPRQALGELPTGAFAMSVPSINFPAGDIALLTSARQHLVRLGVYKGDVISQITFVAGGTALVTGSNQWFSLYSNALAKLGVTSDDTSTAWAAQAAKTLTLASPYTVLADGYVYAGVTVVASTPPTLRCQAGSAFLTGIAPIKSGTSNTGLTNPASAPATATLSANANVPLCWFS